MLLRSFCPRCGQKKEYIAEQVGKAGYCDNCGTEFLLKANDGRVVWKLASATLVVVAIIGVLVVRMSYRFHAHDRLPIRSTAVSYDHSIDADDD